MRRSVIPEKYVIVPSAILYSDLPPGLIVTYAKLKGLAWGNNETPELSMNQILKLIGIPISTLYGHMKILRDRGALRWRTAQDHTIIVSFSVDSHTGTYSEIPESPNEEVKSKNTQEKRSGCLLHNHPVMNLESTSTKPSKSFLEWLIIIGVFEKNIPEICNCGWTENQIRITYQELESECKPKYQIPALLIGRIRNHKPPKDPMDLKKYISGDYGEFVKH